MFSPSIELTTEIFIETTFEFMSATAFETIVEIDIATIIEMFREIHVEIVHETTIWNALILEVTIEITIAAALFPISSCYFIVLLITSYYLLLFPTSSWYFLLTPTSSYYFLLLPIISHLYLTLFSSILLYSTFQYFQHSQILISRHCTLLFSTIQLCGPVPHATSYYFQQSNIIPNDPLICCIIFHISY